jgi:hypothetical protein
MFELNKKITSSIMKGEVGFFLNKIKLRDNKNH